MKYAIIIGTIVAALSLGGCGGSKVLKEPQPLLSTQPLASATDRQITATLDWVIVRDGPGTWAKNAYWDEYLLHINNQSHQSIQLTGLVVTDSLQTRIEPEHGRKKLVSESRRTSRLYRDSGVEVKAGLGTGSLLAAGAAVTAIGVGVGSAAAYGAVLSGVPMSAGGGVIAGGLVLAGPMLAVGGIMKGVNNHAVNEQIEKRQTLFPIDVSAGTQQRLDVFFPVAPSPETIELLYTDADGERSLVVDVRASLQGLHIRTTSTVPAPW